MLTLTARMSVSESKSTLAANLDELDAKMRIFEEFIDAKLDGHQEKTPSATFAQIKEMAAFAYVRGQPMRTWRVLAKNDPDPNVRKEAANMIKNLPWWFCCMCCF
jgi:hypothetical protein